MLGLKLNHVSKRGPLRDPFWWRAEHVHDMACSPPQSSAFLDKLQPTHEGQHAAILAQWQWGHPCLRSRPQLCPKHAQWESCLNSAGQSMTSTSCCAKSRYVKSSIRRGIVLGIHKDLSKNAHRPGKHTITEKSDVVLAVEGSIQHQQFTPLTMENGIPNHDCGAMVTVRGLNRHI